VMNLIISAIVPTDSYMRMSCRAPRWKQI
jgi:hypothetical protein